MSKMRRAASDSQLCNRSAATTVAFHSSPTTSSPPSLLSRQNSLGHGSTLTDSTLSVARHSACSEKSLSDIHCSKDSIRGESKALTSMLRMSEEPFRTIRSSSIQYLFSADPDQWDTNLSPDAAEDDDYLHNPDAGTEHKGYSLVFISRRGLQNVGCLVVLIIGLVGLFAGFPIASHFTIYRMPTLGGFNFGGINASGQIPSIDNYGLIDNDTPKEAYTKTGWYDGTEMELVFSDEFNTDGRSFYPGDDPYWEAADMHYWSTNDMEWFDPAAVTTVNGALQITMSEKNTHNLKFQSGQLTTWNKFCFTGGYVEANISLPGVTNISGFRPSIWTLGNLGRAGYGASLDGTWPYTYDACDVGTAPNQTINELPHLATVRGDSAHGGALSYLPGQRLSRCTCPGESHPGPVHPDGTYVGRSAPEIDIFEGLVNKNVGKVSQSSQWAPFNYAYEWFATSENLVIPNKKISNPNSYASNVIKQTASVLTTTNQSCYSGEAGCFSVYGVEYEPGFDHAYITWVSDNKVAWTAKAAGFAADSRVNISARPVSQEPMYIIMQFGMSEQFEYVDLKHLPFPSTMLVDYIRIYQKKGQKNIGCDPVDFPTADYINTHIEAYTNPNLTTWVNDYEHRFPRSSLLDGCD